MQSSATYGNARRDRRQAIDIKTRPLGNEIPDQWDYEHVGRRLVDALRTLRNLPDSGRPAGYGSPWPSYTHEWGDLLAQQQAEIEDKKRGEAQANWVRVQPSAKEISRMEILLYGAIPHAATRSEIAAKAALVWATKKSVKENTSGCPQALGIGKRKFWWERKHGLTICMQYLQSQNIAVW